MFKRLDEDPGVAVPVTLDGRSVTMTEGDNLAAQLLLLGALPLRQHTVDGSPRSPFCMIGNCFDCLVEIDGRPNQQACMTQVRRDMVIRRQLSAPAQGNTSEDPADE